jgi:hypothetical protein
MSVDSLTGSMDFLIWIDEYGRRPEKLSAIDAKISWSVSFESQNTTHKRRSVHSELTT